MLVGRRRTVLVVVAALVLIVGLPLAFWRAFRPQDSVQPAAGAYPPVPTVAPGLYGSLLRMPLLVDGRLRVYAAQREVFAEQPATTKSSLTPYWSLRRWPQSVQGVVAVGTAVASLWSDGRLYVTDARTGRVRWWISTTAGGGYQGRRTGAATVYAPPHLTTWGNLAIIGGSGTRATIAVDLTSPAGRPAWSVALCAGQPYTTGGVLVCPGIPGDPGGARLYRASDGTPVAWSVDAVGGTPFGCGPGRSACAGFRVGGQAYLVGADGQPAPAPALAPGDTWLAGDVVVTGTPDGTVSAATLDGRPLWRWLDAPPLTPVATGPDAPRTQVVAASADAVYLVTAGRDLVRLDPGTGREVSRSSLVPEDARAFQVGWVYAADGLVFVERLRPGASADDTDTAYYFPNPGVLVAGS